MASKSTNGKVAVGGKIVKLVVTHRGALMAKYKATGYAQLKKALEAMAAVDAKSGITLKLALLDPAAPGIGPSKTPNAAKCKRAIDALYKKFDKPDYVLLLGGPDVVPHQPLRNPWAGEEDEELVVPSDLPYACDQAHSLDAAKFLGPTRVVGRLPDIPGSRDVSYLLQLIQNATTAKPLKGKTCFGLSAEIWKGASVENLKQIFGATQKKLHCSPKLGPVWKTPDISHPLHLINCHGNTEHPLFTGQPGSGEEDYPAAIDPEALRGRLTRNAVVAAECCYGAELYEPRGLLLPQGMALTYLEEGAMAFLGSSTIAYGGFEAPDVTCADVVCSRFMSQLLEGASTGRALLESRQSLIAEAMTLDNFQLKTLAQFMLLGDPTYRPFRPRPLPLPSQGWPPSTFPTARTSQNLAGDSAVPPRPPPSQWLPRRRSGLWAGRAPCRRERLAPGFSTSKCLALQSRRPRRRRSVRECAPPSCGDRQRPAWGPRRRRPPAPHANRS